MSILQYMTIYVNSYTMPIMYTPVNDIKSYRFVINRFKMPKDWKLNHDIPTINIIFGSYIFN